MVKKPYKNQILLASLWKEPKISATAALPLYVNISAKKGYEKYLSYLKVCPRQRSPHLFPQFPLKWPLPSSTSWNFWSKWRWCYQWFSAKSSIFPSTFCPEWWCPGERWISSIYDFHCFHCWQQQLSWLYDFSSVLSTWMSATNCLRF